MFDLNLLPLHMVQGQPAAEMPGFCASSPPKRAARGRQDDQLILYMHFRGANISAASQQQWLLHLTNLYFNTSGSITSAMRAVIDTLNISLLERNLKLAAEKGKVVGALTVFVLHREHVFLAQSGLVHSYVLGKKGFHHFCDLDLIDRELGISRTPTVRFFQAEINPGDYLFVSAQPPKTWTQQNLASAEMPALDQLRRRLFNQIPADVHAGVLQILKGNGSIQVSQWQRVPTSILSEVEKAERDAVRNQAKPPAPTSAIRLVDLQNSEQKNAAQPVAAQPITPHAPVQQAAPKPTPQQADATDYPQPHFEELHAKPKSPDRETLAKFFRWWRKTSGDIKQFFSDLLLKIVPSAQENPPKLSTATMLIIAVVVPLVIVAIGAGIYTKRGKQRQFDYYYAQAQSLIQQAAQASDAASQRSAWSQALIYLDQAEDYKQTEALTTLKQQAQASLDVLDGARRLVFRPALSAQLPESVQIAQILPVNKDLYLLDSNSGRVIFLAYTSSGYTADTKFSCEPGQYADVTVGALIDLVAVPINNAYQSPMIGIDASGNILYCAPGKDANAVALPQPEEGLGQISAAAYDAGGLYLLDATQQTIWVYGLSAGSFGNPKTFFATSERLDLSGAIDFTVHELEIFVLYADNHLGSCVASGLVVNPMKCTPHVELVDNRGQTAQPFNLQAGASFSRILYTPPPVPSIYLMEPASGDMYHFSLTFNLQQILRADLGNYPRSVKSASAFAIAPNRVAYLAYGNQLFYATIQ